MPSNYAHYRFGAAMLDKMPGDIRRTVKRFRRLYDVGLHGPDIFFYYNPIIDTKVGKLGTKFHTQTGKEFFTRVCRALRFAPSEAGFAYLYGVLSHFCLDSACHPFIAEAEKTTGIPHLKLEAEFDRYLLELDGKVPAHCQDLSPHIRLIPAEYPLVSAFYPGTTPNQIRDAVRNMAYVAKAVAMPDGLGRTLVTKGISAVSKTYADLILPESSSPVCQPANEQLLKLYENALEKAAVLLEQIGAHLTYNAPLGEDFSAAFDY